MVSVQDSVISDRTQIRILYDQIRAERIWIQD